MEIPNGQKWQNSVLWRRAKYHGQVAEFLLHKYKKVNKSKFRVSNTLLKTILVSLRQHFARTQQQ
jgi:hypothetical protein